MEHPLTIRQAARDLRSKKYTAVELLQSCMDRADAFDKELGVYIRRFDEEALAAAKKADEELAAGRDRGLLHGIPIGIKDNIFTAEAETTGNTSVKNSRWARREDATVVARLREAGAVITGKVTTMELALGLPDETKPFPYPRNPWDLRRWAGGSSSGSAIGVSVGMFLGALGSDTGGSIRIPASLCGITGVKQSFGLCPKDNVIPLGNSLDVVGPLTRSSDDAAVMLQVMAGHSSKDDCSARWPVPNFEAAIADIGKIRVGVHRSQLSGEHVDPEFPEVFERAVGVFADMGAEIIEVEPPMYDEVTAATIITWNSESFAYHRRALQEQWSAFGLSVRAALTAGCVFSAADYIQAQKVRRLAIDKVSQLFQTVDFVVSPTVTGVAPLVDGFDQGKMYRSVFTNYWSGVGNPVINLPIGFNSEGLPFGFQVAADHFRESELLSFASKFQQMTNWHLQVPALVKGA